ncbi:plasmid recombination protein [Rheinheimera texasensis]|uniref:plasmid recombination protein n=1 Tax=Rheinheimera texasensis TaxID=306205 RepID=UPI0004E247BF|nr:plasmid recombination protein [Rheinheimera texasensis]
MPIPSKRHLNRCLVGTSDIKADLLRHFEQIGIDTGQDLRKNGVLAVEAVLAFSPQWVRTPDGKYTPDAKEKIRDWIAISVKWLRAQFRDNFVNAVLHCDEQNFHIHACISVSYFNDRWQKYRLSSDRFFGNKKKLSNLQTSYAKALECTGLQRGVQGSKASHKDLKEFYRELNLAKIASQNLGLESPENSPVKLEKWKNSISDLSDEAFEYHEQRLQEMSNEAAYWRQKYEQLQMSLDGDDVLYQNRPRNQH